MQLNNNIRCEQNKYMNKKDVDTHHKINYYFKRNKWCYKISKEPNTIRTIQRSGLI